MQQTPVNGCGSGATTLLGWGDSKLFQRLKLFSPDVYGARIRQRAGVVSQDESDGGEKESACDFSVPSYILHW